MPAFYFSWVNEVSVVTCFVVVVQWMHSISRRALLLTGWPRTPLCFTVSQFCGSQQQTTNWRWKTVLPRALNSVIIHTQPANNNQREFMWLLLLLLDQTRVYAGSQSIWTDSAHHCANKCQSFTLRSPLYRAVFLLHGSGGLQTYILDPSLKDDLMGLTAAITILAGVNRNNM